MKEPEKKEIEFTDVTEMLDSSFPFHPRMDKNYYLLLINNNWFVGRLEEYDNRMCIRLTGANSHMSLHMARKIYRIEDDSFRLKGRLGQPI